MNKTRFIMLILVMFSLLYPFTHIEIVKGDPLNDLEREAATEEFEKERLNDSIEEQEDTSENIINGLSKEEIEETEAESKLDEPVEETIEKDKTDEEDIKEQTGDSENIKQDKVNREIKEEGSVQKSSRDILLKRGDSNERVLELKVNLSKLGFVVSKNPNINYGPSTERTVKEFQVYYGLKETGVADEQTLAKIDGILSSALRKGQSHPDVISLKENLSQLGFVVSANPNTNYGPSTERIVKEFQKYYGLKETGIADERTLAKVDEILASALRKGQSHPDVIILKENLSKLGFVVSKSPNTNYGPSTERVVKEFQKFYGLNINGIADEITLAKIEELINTPMQRGSYRKDVVDLKLKLAKLGFVISSNPTPTYGPSTERTVKEFQVYYGLKETGVADDQTLAKIDEILSSALRKGQSHPDVIILKENLSQLGFVVSANPNTNYGPSTERIVKEFQKYYGLKETGVADERTLAKIDEILSSALRKGQSHPNVIILKENLSKLGFVVSANPNTNYGPSTERVVKDFQKYYGLKETGVADERTLAKIDEILSSFLRNGQSHPDVIILKENLSKLGFVVSNNPNTNYGPSTERVVRSFQRHYNLRENGIADERTLAKIKNILSSPFQIGKKHKDTIQLKKDLKSLGFGSFKYLNASYGPQTAESVKEFQKHYGLPISGIADEITLAKIKQAAQTREVTTYKKYDATLEGALNIQMNQLQQTDKYRNEKAFVHGDYINFIGLTSGSRSNLRASPTSTSSANIRYTVDRGTKVTIQKEIKSGSSTWYEVAYKNETLYAHSSILNPSNTLAQTTANVNVRAAENTSSHIYETIAKGKEVTILKKGGTWHEISISAWRNPTRTDVEQYLNPSNNDKFQHLVLSASVGVSASELNKVLAGKGILNGLGQAFIDGGKKHSVNEIYLISHALLETGHGTSRLARGIEVGKNKSGNLVLVTASNRNSLTAIKTTYNMFGIGAADADPNRLGAIRAYEEGWFTPKAAVVGGAKFIGDRYIHNAYGQNTLYKMRWNPANPGYPQYATDIAWAVKQVTQIKNMYSMLSNPFLRFDIAQYK